METGRPKLRSARLLDQLRERIRYCHYSLRTEQAYVFWVRRFIRFHHLRHPREMGAAQAERFLMHLATDRQVAPSTHRQALAAILFLYRQVLDIDLPWLQEIGPTEECAEDSSRPLTRRSDAAACQHRPRPWVLARNHKLRELIFQKLSIDWSPHQISGWLKVAYPDDESMRVAHETIYRTLYIGARGVLNPQLTRHLRRHQCMRIPRAARHPRARSPAFPMQSASPSAPFKSRVVPSQVIGKVTCSVETRHRRSLLWSNANRASSWW
jgi:hypothetical protein